MRSVVHGFSWWIVDPPSKWKDLNMPIGEYSFGKIVIDGKTYTSQAPTYSDPVVLLFPINEENDQITLPHTASGEAFT